MSATIVGMVEIDKLLPSQLEAGDIVKVNSRYLSVVDVISVDEGYQIIIEDEWGDEIEIDVAEDRKISIYMEV